MATIHFYSVHVPLPQVFFGVPSRAFSAMRTSNSQNYSYVHYSLSKSTGKWFTNHANQIHIFTPITLIVATQVWKVTQHTFHFPRYFCRVCPLAGWIQEAKYTAPISILICLLIAKVSGWPGVVGTPPAWPLVNFVKL